MKYIIIEGRMPQDGSKAIQALVMFPKWMSPTLVCAGITGRVIEMTDGSIVETGNVPMSEAETLEGLRIDAATDLESQQEQELQATGSLTPSAELPNSDPHAVDNAYREGMQANRDALTKRFLAKIAKTAKKALK